MAGDAVKASFDFVAWRQKSVGYKNACMFLDLLIADPMGWSVAETTARAMALYREEQLQHLAHAERGKCSRAKASAAITKVSLFVEDADTEVKKRAQEDFIQMIGALQGSFDCPPNKVTNFF